MEPLGYLPPPQRLITLGGAMYTVHFVDATHLLFTFNSHGLMPRLPDATPDDDDRNVAALLLELPSGKVLARTTWRTRDRNQYLWPLGHGYFLLRIREKLTVIQPVANMDQENPFREQSFLQMTRHIGYITVSPGGDLLTVETVPPKRSEPSGPASTLAQTPGLHTRPAGGGQNAGAADDDGKGGEAEVPGRPPVELHFFRLAMESTPGKPDRLVARAAGRLASRSLVNLPVTSEGFLDVLKESNEVYNFDFETHTGKRMQLSAYDTTCVPRPYFVSRSEFVAFGCHGAAEKIELSGFNLRGEEPWVSVFSGQHVSPAIISAPAASRFALSRVLINVTGAFDPETIQPDELTTQEIVVMQNHDGRSLLKLQVTPVQRSGQNFDLSADGLQVVVVRNGVIEVYRVPGLTNADRKDVEMATAAQPERNEALVRLITEKKVAKTPVAEAVTVPTAPAEAAQPAPPVATVGDVHPTDGPRKAPSLYDPEHPKPQD